MLYALIAVALIAGIAVIALADQLRRQTREQARERQLLISQVMHLSGRTWQAPPAATEPEPEYEPDQSMYVPSGMPDFYAGEEL